MDYDLPQGSTRIRFYRAIRRWLRERQVKDVEWSTYSVIITRDEEFARFAYDTAVTIGRAHLYRAQLVK